MKKSTLILISIICTFSLFVAEPCFPYGPPYPLDQDKDNDGLCDLCEEYIFGTSYSKSDSDENGIPDGDEDHDLDGITNLVELNNTIALDGAIYQGDTETIVALLDYIPYIPAIDRYGKTALITAAMRGQIEVVRVLLQAGVDVDEGDYHGRTALAYAAGSETEIVRILLQAGADVNAKPLYGDTALMKAAGYGSLEIVKMLIEAGADVNARDQGGLTALIIAQRAEHTKIVELLIEAGAEE